ncbi:transmembrane protein, putative, partial [Bodo saltans]
CVQTISNVFAFFLFRTQLYLFFEAALFETFFVVLSIEKKKDSGAPSVLFSLDMSSQTVALRFSDLVDGGLIEQLPPFLDDNIVISTWNGVVYGKEKAESFFNDYRRYMHHKHNFDKWKQVHHSLDASLQTFSSEGPSMVLPEDRVERTRRIVTGRITGGDPHVAQYFDESGYDSQGFAMFERNGVVGSHPKYAFLRLPVRQVIVVKNGLVVLYELSMRR